MGSSHEAAFRKAVTEGDTDAVRAMLAAEPGLLESRTDEGRTPLHDAIESGHGRLVDLLLDHGAHVDICAAAILGREARVQELLAEDPRRADDRSTQLSPLGWAAFGNQCGTATQLLDAGARTDDGELLCAASVNAVEVGRLLIRRGVDPNGFHRDSGGTALHAAASMRYAHDTSRFVEMLLEEGADPGLRTSHGKTALAIAEENARRQAEALEAAESGGPPVARVRAYERVADLLRPVTPSRPDSGRD